MYPRAFEYFAPDSIPEVLELLSRYGEEAKLLAGGQSLIPLMKLRLVNPRILVDIGRLQHLTYVREEDDSLRLAPVYRVSGDESSHLLRATGVHGRWFV